MKMVNQVNPPTNQSSASDWTSLLFSTLIAKVFSDPNLIMILRVINENRNVGFRGRICNSCFSCWVDPIYNDGGEMKSLLDTKSSIHKCDTRKVADAQKVQNIEIKKSELENILITSLLYLTTVCSLLYSKKPFLKTEELNSPPQSTMDLMRKQISNYSPGEEETEQVSYLRCWVEGKEVNCNPINVELATATEKHWGNRAISECVKNGKSSVEIDSNELIDFLKVTRGTFGVITTDVGDSIRNFLIYVSFTK
jgi:hypothetical protein